MASYNLQNLITVRGGLLAKGSTETQLSNLALEQFPDKQTKSQILGLIGEFRRNENRKKLTADRQEARGQKLGLPSWILSVTEENKQVLQGKVPITIAGQFPPDDFTVNKNVSAKWAEISSTNSQHPILQFVSGGLTTVTFNAMFVSQSRNDVENKVNALMQMTQIIPELGRPPICTYTYGNEMTMKCIVESVQTNKWQVQPNGSLRQATLSITLKKFVPYEKAKNIPVGKKIPIMRTVAMKPGETFEQFSKRVYGTPKYGPCLRKLYPGAETQAIVKKSSEELGIEAPPINIDAPSPEWMSANCRSTRKKSLKTKELQKKVYDRNISEINPNIKDNSLITLNREATLKMHALQEKTQALTPHTNFKFVNPSLYKYKPKTYGL